MIAQFQLWILAIILCGVQVEAFFEKNSDQDAINSIDKESADDLTKDISFLCYPNISMIFDEVTHADSFGQLASRCIKNTKKTIIFYFPGWTNLPSQHDERVDSIIREYLKRGGILPIVVNYENLVTGPNVSSITVPTFLPAMMKYNNARKNVEGIGDNVADVLIALYKNKALPMDNLRLVGLSLGAQIQGRVGRRFFKETKQKLQRITGLDPAGAGFYSTEHLSESDAVFVDIIHTNPGILGFPFPTGTVDFYVNFPIPLQPGCPSIDTVLNGSLQPFFCSHEKSAMYYLETINSPKKYPSCRTILPCTTSPILTERVYMGYDVSTRISGVKNVPVKSKF